MRARWDRMGDFAHGCFFGLGAAVLQLGLGLLLFGSQW